MTEKIVWKCDGCDDELVVKDGKSGDWKLYAVTLDNARGYPLNREGDKVEVSAHLCANCARQLERHIHPKSWPRATAAQP